MFEVAAMVRKIVWAPQLSYSFCNFEAHGHLDTVHGLGHVDKHRNDVCTNVQSVPVRVNLATSFGNYGHGHCTAHADGVSIADRSSVPGGRLGVTA